MVFPHTRVAGGGPGVAGEGAEREFVAPGLLGEGVGSGAVSVAGVIVHLFGQQVGEAARTVAGRVQAPPFLHHLGLRRSDRLE